MINKISRTRKFKRLYLSLPGEIQKKFEKQIRMLINDFHYPSLHVKKIQGHENIWEARVDIHYRFTFELVQDTLFLRAIGNHEVVLKNP